MLGTHKSRFLLLPQFSSARPIVVAGQQEVVAVTTTVKTAVMVVYSVLSQRLVVFLCSWQTGSVWCFPTGMTKSDDAIPDWAVC
jgi:hypothetical protein